jgi:hypothetical protein
MDIVLCGMVLLTPCDVSQCLKRAEVIDLPVFDQYALFLVGMGKKCFLAFRHMHYIFCTTDINMEAQEKLWNC